MATVITGGAGFIGSHLCDHFLRAGHTVVAVDSFLTGRRENIQHLIGNSRFTLVERDVCCEWDVSGSVENVLHFASPASPSPTSPVGYMQLSIETLRAGSLGTLNALEFARRKSARFLLASTSEIYGDPEVTPQVEDYVGHVSSIAPRSCYDESKRFAEAATMAYQRRYGLPTRIVRIFNTYGPRMRLDDGRVLPNFFGQALRGEPITVYGDGSHTRSFCYVDDLVSGIWRLLHSDIVMPVNLGSADEIPIRTLADEVIELTASGSIIEYGPIGEGDPKRRQPDLRRAKTLLNWSAQVSRRDGLQRTADYFRRELSGATLQ